jgi:hypothetical protein
VQIGPCRNLLTESSLGAGSSGWIRTSNPPINRLMQVVYLVGSSRVYLTLGTRFSLVFGNKLFTDCSLWAQIEGTQAVITAMSLISGIHSAVVAGSVWVSSSPARPSS